MLKPKIRISQLRNLKKFLETKGESHEIIERRMSASKVRHLFSAYMGKKKCTDIAKYEDKLKHWGDREPDFQGIGHDLSSIDVPKLEKFGFVRGSNSSIKFIGTDRHIELLLSANLNKELFDIEQGENYGKVGIDGFKPMDDKMKKALLTIMSKAHDACSRDMAQFIYKHPIVFNGFVSMQSYDNLCNLFAYYKAVKANNAKIRKLIRIQGKTIKIAALAFDGVTPEMLDAPAPESPADYTFPDKIAWQDLQEDVEQTRGMGWGD